MARTVEITFLSIDLASKRVGIHYTLKTEDKDITGRRIDIDLESTETTVQDLIDAGMNALS